MRTRNPSYGRSRDVTLGRVAARRASSTGITVTDGTTDVSPTTEIQFRGLEVADLTEGVAEVTNSGLGNFITNGDATDLAYGDVVVLDATTNTVLKTTTAQDTRPVGVVQRSMLVGESGPVIFSGFVDLVNVGTASVTAGYYAETSTTAGQATENSARREGSFGVYLTAGTAPTAMLFSTPDTFGSAVIVDTYLTSDSGERHVVTTGTASGTAQTLDLSASNYFDLTLTANCTVTLSNPAETGTLGVWTVRLLQGGSGSYTVTWPAAVMWRAADGTQTSTAATLGTAVGASDTVILTTLDGGSSYGASIANDITDHGHLAGLTDDDHTQYTKKATLTTTGDIYYASGASTPARLGIGATDEVLTVASGVPAWVALPTPVGELLISDTPSTPLIFADLLQNEAQDDLLYADP